MAVERMLEADTTTHTGRVLEEGAIIQPPGPVHELQTVVGLSRLVWAFRLMILSTLLTFISGAIVVRMFMDMEWLIQEEAPGDILSVLAGASLLYLFSYIIRGFMVLFWLMGMTALWNGMKELGPYHEKRLKAAIGTMMASVLLIVIGTVVTIIAFIYSLIQGAGVNAVLGFIFVEFALYSIGMFLFMYGHVHLVYHLSSPGSKIQAALALKLNIASVLIRGALLMGALSFADQMWVLPFLGAFTSIGSAIVLFGWYLLAMSYDSTRKDLEYGRLWSDATEFAPAPVAPPRTTGPTLVTLTCPGCKEEFDATVENPGVFDVECPTCGLEVEGETGPGPMSG